MFAVVLSIHLIVCAFLVVLVLLQKSEGGGLGIGQSSAGLGDFLTARGASNILTKTTSFLAVCFSLHSNSTPKKFFRVTTGIKSSMGIAARSFLFEDSTILHEIDSFILF